MADTDDKIMLLKVGSTSQPQSVASAIFKSITDSGIYPDLRAIGHGAVGQAVKGIAIARGHVAARGIDLACNIGFETIDNDKGEPISAMVFRTFDRHR